MVKSKKRKAVPSSGTTTQETLPQAKGEVCSEEARKRILDAAQTLFAIHGFNATTTKAIAEQAEVPGGLIFYYFPTKKALLQSIIDERNILTELRVALETRTAPDPDPRSALITLGLRYLDILKQHKELACIMLREFRTHPEVATQFHELREEQIRFIASYLRASLDAGHYRPLENIQTLARMFLYNFIVIGIIEELPEPLPFVEDMVDILMCKLA